MILLGIVIIGWLFVGVWRHLQELAPQTAGVDDWSLRLAEQGKRAVRQWEREMRRWDRAQRGHGTSRRMPERAEIDSYRARRHAAAQGGFFIHALSYLGVIGLLAVINLLTSSYAWFIWPAVGWGFGLFAHWMAVFGSDAVRARYFDPAVCREVAREKSALRTEKQADIGALSSTIAHEIRNPIAAAKSLVQQMAEDPQSIENVEYARVAVGELDRVERRIAHLLRYAREEDYEMAPVNLATVVDGALTQLRARLESGNVQAVRHYIGGPTVRADADKLQGVFVNVIDNAIDALSSTDVPRRIELFIDNGASAVVRLRDNGPGMSADQLSKIFNPFFTTKEHGTGLGMAIAKKTVEAHGGAMSASSEAEHGAEFTVTLPLPR